MYVRVLLSFMNSGHFLLDENICLPNPRCCLRHKQGLSFPDNLFHGLNIQSTSVDVVLYAEYSCKFMQVVRCWCLQKDELPEKTYMVLHCKKSSLKRVKITFFMVFFFAS